MKCFKFISVVFLALLFAVACGSGTMNLKDQEGENQDENQIDTDSDAVAPDTDPDSQDTGSDSGDTAPDSGDSADTGDDPDTGEDPDSGDTLPDEEIPDEGPDADSAEQGDTDPAPMTREEICSSVGGTYSNGACFKDLNCGELPRYAEWNNGATARQNYDFETGAWELVPPAEYDDSETPGVCTYKCEEGTIREENECKNLCSAKFNGTDSYIFLDNDPRSIFDSGMGNAWTIEFWYKQETAPDKSNYYAAPILRRGGSNVTTPTFGCYPILKYTQQTGPMQNVYGYMKNSFQTTYSYKENQWSQQTQTKEQSYSFEQQQIEDLHENEWVHVAITGESTQSQQNWQNKAKLTLKLYVAGKYLGEEDGSGDIDAASTITLKSMDDGLYIGGNLKYAQNQQYSQYSFFFKGLVSGLRISNAVVYDGDFTPAYNIDAADTTLESWMFDHGKIIKAKANEIVPEENFNNIEWSTDCPGQE